MKNSIQPVNITIDGQALLVKPELTILQAAQQEGIHIPTLCHHPALSERGGCRVCVVEVDGAPRLAASCVTPVRDGMEVVTVNERIVEARRTIVAFLFAERNHNCMFCPQSGDCELQNLAYELQMDHLSVPQSFHAFPVDFTSDAIGLDHNRCILCGRCVRACEEIAGCYVLDFHNRGPGTLIGFDLNERREESACTNCGVCLQVCPTGALYNRYRTHYAVKGHSGNRQAVRTICPLCGLQCPIVITSRDNHPIKIEGVIPAGDGRPDGGQLCRRGRFDVLKNPYQRLLKPMVKRSDGSWAEASWENALDITVDGLSAVRDTHGSDALSGLVSGLSSNEELVCFRDLMVNGWGTGKIAVLEDSGFANIYKSDPDNEQKFKEVSWKKIAEADFILTISADNFVSQPVVGALIRKCVFQNNMRSAVVGPGDVPYPYGNRHVRIKKGEELLLIETMLREALCLMKKTAFAADIDSILHRTEPVAFPESLNEVNLDRASRSVLNDILRDYMGSSNPLIVVGQDVAAQNNSPGLRALVNLARLKGLYGNDRLRLIVLKPCGNSMGAYKLLHRSNEKSETRNRPRGVLALLEYDPFHDASELKIPADLDFLTIISPYRSDVLADRAHVLLPKPSWMETAGTCTSLDGCEINFRQKILEAPTGIYPSWQTMAALAARANVSPDYDSWDALRQYSQREIQQDGPVEKEASGDKT